MKLSIHLPGAELGPRRSGRNLACDVHPRWTQARLFCFDLKQLRRNSTPFPRSFRFPAGPTPPQFPFRRCPRLFCWQLLSTSCSCSVPPILLRLRGARRTPEHKFGRPEGPAGSTKCLRGGQLHLRLLAVTGGGATAPATVYLGAVEQAVVAVERSACMRPLAWDRPARGCPARDARRGWR